MHERKTNLHWVVKIPLGMVFPNKWIPLWRDTPQLGGIALEGPASRMGACYLSASSSNSDPVYMMHYWLSPKYLYKLKYKDTINHFYFEKTFGNTFLYGRLPKKILHPQIHMNLNLIATNQLIVFNFLKCWIWRKWKI